MGRGLGPGGRRACELDCRRDHVAPISKTTDSPTTVSRRVTDAMTYAASRAIWSSLSSVRDGGQTQATSTNSTCTRGPLQETAFTAFTALGADFTPQPAGEANLVFWQGRKQG